MKLLFWAAALGVAYSYFLYPLILLLLPRRRIRRGYAGESSLPAVTLIITAHNEAGRIAEKIENSLAVRYPPDRFEILIASDASTDETDAIAARYADHGVRLTRTPERLGKENAQGLAVRNAKGEILIFSDAGTTLPTESIQCMVSNFADERVGAVSSEDRFISQDGKIVGEGLYVRYEMWLRRLESAVNSLVGLSGSFFGVRASLCRNWDIFVPSDFNCALQSVRQGRVAVTDPEVLGIYRDIKDAKREYQRKVRTIIRGITAVMRQPSVLNPLRMGLFAFQVWSHKIMRWAVPWFLMLLLVASVALAKQGAFYAFALLLQIAGYAAALLGWCSTAAGRSVLVRIPYFFVQVNVAMAHAAIAYLMGRRITVWTPSAR